MLDTILIGSVVVALWVYIVMNSLRIIASIQEYILRSQAAKQFDKALKDAKELAAMQEAKNPIGGTYGDRIH